MPFESRDSRDFRYATADAEQGEPHREELFPLSGLHLQCTQAPADNIPQASRSKSCRLYVTIFGLVFFGLVLWSPLSLRQADLWGALALFLPNLGHLDSKGNWIADTWDHFKLPDCDPGPPPEYKKRIPYWVNESVWVPPKKAYHMDGKFWVFPNESNGGHWVPAHDVPAEPGHFISVAKKHYKEVPFVRTAEQDACAEKMKSADAYHQKLIAQHAEFQKARAEMEELLQWQATHSCGAQSANVVFHGSAAAKEPDGDKSGAHCQRACTEKLFDAFTWTKEDGCLLLRKGSGSTWKAEPQHGAYSGYPCQQDLVAINWITDEAQKHTLLDGVSPPKSSLTGHGTAGTVLCVMLIQPYTTDIDLVLLQQSHKAGIFSCDQHAVYSSQVLRLSAGLHTRRINDSQMVETGGQWNSALDTDLALAFWRAVVSDPEWLQVKWIVRASAETVFKFDALHSILLKQETVQNVDRNPTYLVAAGDAGFPAYFQVLSQTALQQFGLMSRECFWQMRYWGDVQWPQAMWMDKCFMDTVHARRPVIDSMVGNHTGEAACHDTHAIAYHSVKLAEQRKCFGDGAETGKSQRAKPSAKLTSTSAIHDDDALPPTLPPLSDVAVTKAK